MVKHFGWVGKDAITPLYRPRIVLEMAYRGPVSTFPAWETLRRSRDQREGGTSLLVMVVWKGRMTGELWMTMGR